jgi:Methyltransferase domain
MTTSPHPPLPRRIALKFKRIVRELDKDERAWGKVWPMIQPIEGWLCGGQERWLFDTARALSDGANLVEIGSYKGRSTCCLGFGCRGTGKRVFAIDPFNGGPDLPLRDSFAEFSANINRCELSDYVTPKVGTSLEIAQGWNRPIHFLFIDGSHKYEDVVADFEAYLPYVVEGGIVGLHDVDANWPGVLKAWNDVCRHRLVELGACASLAYGRKP